MAKMQAIVVYTPKADHQEPEYFGPFPDGDTANRWGRQQQDLRGWKPLEWYWDNLQVPV